MGSSCFLKNASKTRSYFLHYGKQKALIRWEHPGELASKCNVPAHQESNTVMRILRRNNSRIRIFLGRKSRNESLLKLYSMFLNNGSVTFKGKVCDALYLNQTIYSFFAIRFCQKSDWWNFQKKEGFFLHLRALKNEKLRAKWSPWHLNSGIGLWTMDSGCWMLDAIFLILAFRTSIIWRKLY